jgi:hypothetical protein
MFADSLGEVAAAAGKYSDGNRCYSVNSNGIITQFFSCGESPTTTTTSTTLPPTPLSPIVQNFVNATGITGSAITYVQTLYTQLVAANLFNKMYAIYPFVGANATSHKYNLIDTGSYTITFNGGWLHNSNGITGNGYNTYANTGIVPSTFNTPSAAFPGDLWFVSSSMHIYSRTDGASGVDMGGYSNGSFQSILIAKYNSFGSNSTVYANTDNSTAILQPNATGFFGGTTLQSASGSSGVYKDGVKLSEFIPFNPIYGGVSDANIYIGANDYPLNVYPYEGAEEFTNRNYAFASIGKGLTEAEMATYYTIVQNFQTSLNRAIPTSTTTTTSTTTSTTTTTTAAISNELYYSGIGHSRGTGSMYLSLPSFAPYCSYGSNWTTGSLSMNSDFVCYWTGSVVPTPGSTFNADRIVNGVTVPGIIYSPGEGPTGGSFCVQSPLFATKIEGGISSSLIIFPNTSVPVSSGGKIEYWADGAGGVFGYRPQLYAITGSSYTITSLSPYMNAYKFIHTFTSSGNFYYNTFVYPL